MVDAIVGTVETFTRGGYDVVVDRIIEPWFLPLFLTAAKRDRPVLSFVVLRPDLETTLSRVAARAMQT